LSDSDWLDISRIALAWLRSHNDPIDRDLSLASLLTRSNLLPETDLDWVLEEARNWLGIPPLGARRPEKLLTQLDIFRRRYDLDGERFPYELLDGW
jgi:hypothetical protein